MTLRHCTIAHIIDTEHGDTLCSVAIESQHNAQRLLDLVIEAAKQSEGWGHTTASRLLSVSVGDSVIASPAPMTPGTGNMVWIEIRPFFVAVPSATSEVA